MIYSLSEVSKKMNIEERTLKYYAKEGLLPLVEQSASGMLKFKSEDFQWLELLTSLRVTGTSLSDMKEFAKAYHAPEKNKDMINEMLLKYKANAIKRLKRFSQCVDNIDKFIGENDKLIKILSEEKNQISDERKEAIVKNFSELVIKNDK